MLSVNLLSVNFTKKRLICMDEFELIEVKCIGERCLSTFRVLKGSKHGYCSEDCGYLHEGSSFMREKMKNVKKRRDAKRKRIKGE
jgi:hypothetical protein